MITMMYADRKTMNTGRHDTDIEDMIEATAEAMFVFSKFMIDGQPVKRLLDFRLIGMGYDCGDDAMVLVDK